MLQELKPAVQETDLLPAWQKLIETGYPLEPDDIYDFLITFQRKLPQAWNFSRYSNPVTGHWIDWWINHIGDFTDQRNYRKPQNLFRFEKISEKLGRNKLSGALYLTDHNLDKPTMTLAEQTTKFSDIPIFLIHPWENFSFRNGYEKSIVPFRITLSLLSYFRPDHQNLIIGVPPDKNPEESDKEYFLTISEKMGISPNQLFVPGQLGPNCCYHLQPVSKI